MDQLKQLTSREQPIPVYFVLREGTLALDLAGPAEVLRYANRLAQEAGGPGLFKLHYVSAEPQLETSIGLGLTGVAALPEYIEDDALLLLISCAGSDDDFSSAAAEATVAWLRRHVKPSHRLLCICTGALLAGHAGFLDGRQCTTHHSHCERLQELAPGSHVLENRIFVEDGNVYSSAGVLAAIDLMLHVIAGLVGHQFTANIARSMVIYMRRTGADPQLSPWLAFRNHLHPAIHRVQDAIAGNPARDWTVAETARIGCISERHLTRLFREQTGISFVDYLQRIRIAVARELLTQSQLNIEHVAERAGFNSSRQLRRVWKKFEIAPPSEARTNGKKVSPASV